MKHKLRMLTALTLLVLSMLACNLPTRPGLAPATPAPSQPAPVEPLPTAADGAPADPDLPGAVLTTADLPAGFSELSPEDFASLGLDESVITGAFGEVLQNAQPQSLRGFVNRQSFEVVVCYVLAPLTLVERAAFDVFLSNPQNVVERFSGMSASVMDGMEDIGDSSVGVTFTTGQAPSLVRGDVAISRRSNVVTASMVFYLDGSTPIFSLRQAADLMDARISAALK